jgi:hypothetical protein
MTPINTQMWGATPASYVKTLTVTRTRPSNTVEFYSQAVTAAAETDYTRVTAAMRYQTTIDRLTQLPGVTSASVAVVANTEVTSIVIDTLNTTINSVLSTIEHQYPDVITAITEWNQERNITTALSIS